VKESWISFVWIVTGRNLNRPRKISVINATGKEKSNWFILIREGRTNA
jgi:hypothetical protein